MDERLRVSVLGPLLVTRGGTELPVGPPQQRALLAALVLRRGAPASSSELIDEIWGEEAPASASAIVRHYVHGLRRVLAGGTGSVISSSQHGYVADVAADVLDLDVFEGLVARAGQARATGDPATAADLLRQAVALWRGEALAGVPGPGAGRRRSALAQQHLSALTARAELELELGRHREIQPELQTLVLTHPLNEHLRHLLMTALSRCGRRADAMASYQDCARLLADELGVDPGPALQEAYLRLLRADTQPTAADPAPRPTASGLAPRPTPRPASLPAAPAAFVGREETLRLLDQKDGPGPVVIVLAGMGGVGKTTTALHFAHQVATRYPDGQLYADLRGHGPTPEPASLAEVLDGFLRALGVPAADIPRYPSAQAGMFRSLLAERRMLMLLDNAGSVEVVRELLPGAGRNLVLVTSRRTLPGLLVDSGAHLVNLHPPGHDEALAMFAARVGDDRVRAEPVAARSVVERSGRLPLALAVIAARAVAAGHLPLTAIAEELDATRGTLTTFRTTDPSVDVGAVLSWSYRTLSPVAAQAFRRLSLHPGPHVTIPAAASTLGLEPGRTREVLNELTSAALLTQTHPGRYATHDLVRAFGHELAQERDDKQDRGSVVNRMLDHYLHTSWRAAHELFEPRHQIVPGHPVDGVTTSDLDAATWFDTERPVLLAALDSAAKEGLRRFPDASAHLNRSLALFTAAGDQVAGDITRRRIVYLLIEQGDFAAALEQAEIQLAKYSPGTDPASLADTLNTVSWICVQLDRFAEAVDHARRALTLTPELRPYAVADIWDTLGSAQAGQGLVDEAGKSYRRAAEIYHQQGAHLPEAQTCRALGDAWRHAGRTDEAQRAYRRALDLLTGADSPRAARLITDLNRLLRSH